MLFSSHSPVINPNLLSFIHAFGGWLRSEQPTTRKKKKKKKKEIVSIPIKEIMNSSRERERDSLIYPGIAGVIAKENAKNALQLKPCQYQYTDCSLPRYKSSTRFHN